MPSNLDLSSCEIRCELSRCKVLLRSGVTLTLGAEGVVDLRFCSDAVTEQVEVTGEAPLVETTQSSVAALVSGNQISNRPLNNRSYTELASLQEGIVQFRNVGLLPDSVLSYPSQAPGQMPISTCWMAQTIY